MSILNDDSDYYSIRHCICPCGCEQERETIMGGKCDSCLKNSFESENSECRYDSLTHQKRMEEVDCTISLN